MLRIFAPGKDGKDPEPHAFTFTSPSTARAEAESIKDALSKFIQQAKHSNGILAAPANNGATPSSAAMAIAGAVSSLPSFGRGTDAWYDDGQLKSDINLQQSLLRENPLLSKTFVESLRTKPDSITDSQFTTQFWSSRIPLLRAHAIEKNQSRGAYNVLSTMKPRVEEEKIKLSISKEQIQLIFAQHPLVKRVYDENVPRLSESAFWSAFFQSRLFKKLKGEKILEDDPPNAILDKYLLYDEDEERAQRFLASHIPHIIDLEGNEVNHSQRKGNQPDITMRPNTVDRMPILRTLNSLSEKIMSHVAPNDIDPSLPIGVDEETFNSLALRDLQSAAKENSVFLNVRDQSRFFTKKEVGVLADTRRYAQQDPSQVLQSFQKSLSQLSARKTLETTTGEEYDSSSSDDKGEKENRATKKRQLGNKFSLSAATSQILVAIGQQRSQIDDLSSSLASASTAGGGSLNPSTSGLSDTIFDRVALTHATSTEFLQHFWHAFLSGNPNRADEIARLVETLDRAMDRIKAISDDADAERAVQVDRIKQQLQERFERTKRKVRYDFDSIAGGANVVNQLVAPTVKAIQIAEQKYKKALADATSANTTTTTTTTSTLAIPTTTTTAESSKAIR